MGRGPARRPAPPGPGKEPPLAGFGVDEERGRFGPLDRIETGTGREGLAQQFGCRIALAQSQADGAGMEAKSRVGAAGSKREVDLGAGGGIVAGAMK